MAFSMAVVVAVVQGFPPAGFEVQASCGAEGPSIGAVATVPGTAPRPVPPVVGSPHADPIPLSGNGLFGRYYTGPTYAKRPFGDYAFFQVDTDFDRTMPTTAPFDHDYAITWSGWLDASSSGTYAFSLQAFGITQVTLDGATLLYSQDDETDTASPSLDAGRHPITIQYDSYDCTTGTNSIHFKWIPPGESVYEAVPQASLYAPIGPTDSAIYGPGGSAWSIDPSGSQAEPVNTATGNYYTQVTDMSVPAPGLPVAITRTYNSLDTEVGILGQGWKLNLGARLDVGAADGTVTLVTAEGARLAFLSAGRVTFLSPITNYVGLPGVTGQLSFDSGPDEYTLVRNDGATYVFDIDGLLQSETDLHDNTILYDYTGDVLESVTDPAGRQFDFGYEDGRLTSVTDVAERTVEYAYSDGRLHTVTDLDGGVTTYGYDGDGRLTTIVDPNLHTLVTNTYDDLTGRVESQLDARMEETTFAWDAGTQTSTMTDPREGEWVDVYDANRLMSRTDPLDHTTAYTYDANLRRTGVTDANDDTTTYAYDGQGQLIHETAPAPLSYEQSWTYDTDGHVLTHVDRANRTTTYDYDGPDLMETTFPDETTTSATYFANGLIETATDQRGKTTHYDYDDDWNLDTITTPLAEVTTMTYDDVGRMLTKVDPRGNAGGATPADFTTTFGYDDRGHVTSITDPLEHETVIHFDPAGNRDSVTDPNAHETTYGYDEANHVVLVTDADDGETHFHYDEAGNLDLRTDANDHETAYSYYLDGRLHTTTDPMDHDWTLTYDDAGNLKTRTDANDKTTTYDYDELNRLTGVTYDDVSTPAVTYAYDAMGNRAEMADGAGTETYEYDTMNRLHHVSRTTSFASPDEFWYSYDEVGHLHDRQDPDGTTTTLGYDDDERLSTTSTESQPIPWSPPPPTDLTASVNPDGTVDLDWEAPADATGVVGYRVLGINDGWVDPGTTEATDQFMGPGNLYEYRVVSVSAAGAWSVPSSVANGRAGDEGSLYQAAVLGDTPVAYWRLGENTGTSLVDAAGDNDGTYVQGTTLSLGGALLGDANGYAQFDGGAEGYASVPNDASLDLGDGPFSIEFWVSGDSSPGTLIAKDDGTDGFRVGFDIDGRITLADGDGTVNLRSDDPLSAETWHHVVVTRGSSADGHIYVDGADATDTVATPTFTDAVASLTIAARTGGTADYVSAALDEIALYDRELSPLEVADHHDVGVVPIDTTPPTAPADLAATPTGANGIALTWTASTDDTAVAGYEIFRDTEYVGWSLGTTYLDMGLAPAIEHTYEVAAVDRWGSESARSDPDDATVTGPALPSPVTVTTSTAYDEAGNLRTQETGDGVIATYEFDEAGRLRELANVTDTATLSRTTFKLDPAGNRTVATTTHGTQYYTYDELDRLTGVCYDAMCAGLLTPASCINCVGSTISGPSATVTPNGSDIETTYAYDPVGNRLRQTTYLGTTAYDYDDADRLESVTPPSSSPIAYGFDDNGNQTAAGGDSFSWDLADRLVSATVDSATEEYTYAGDGTRLTAVGAGGGTHFLVDQNSPLSQVVGERDSFGVTTRRYVGGAETFGQTDPDGTVYLHGDPLGSVGDVTAANGDPLSWTVFQPFGQVREAGVDSHSPSVPFAYAGQYLDRTGMYNLRAREYSPETGRFLSTDPISLRAGVGFVAAYVYGGNNVTRLVDPSGRESTSPQSRYGQYSCIGGGLTTAALAVAAGETASGAGEALLIGTAAFTGAGLFLVFVAGVGFVAAYLIADQTC